MIVLLTLVTAHNTLQQQSHVLMHTLAVYHALKQKQLVDAVRKVDLSSQNAFKHCLRVDVVILHILYLRQIPATRHGRQ